MLFVALVAASASPILIPLLLLLELLAVELYISCREEEQHELAKHNDQLKEGNQFEFMRVFGGRKHADDCINTSNQKQQ